MSIQIGTNTIHHSNYNLELTRSVRHLRTKINYICRCSYMQKISIIRRYLTKNATVTVRLDEYNGVYTHNAA